MTAEGYLDYDEAVHCRDVTAGALLEVGRPDLAGRVGTVVEYPPHGWLVTLLIPSIESLGHDDALLVYKACTVSRMTSTCFDCWWGNVWPCPH